MNYFHSLILLFSFIVACAVCDWNQTTMMSSPAQRFERILSRKKRFMLFPPGSAIVATLSYTKTLVPTSPSGINMIGECDIFYPLQTKISDWYPTTKAPPTPDEYYDDDNDDSTKNNIGQSSSSSMPSSSPITPAFIPTHTPSTVLSSEMLNPTVNIPSINNSYRLPTVFAPGVLISDPNYNIGKHPGEIYVDKSRKQAALKRRKNDFSIKPNSHRMFSIDENQLWQQSNEVWHPPSPWKYATNKKKSVEYLHRARERRDLYEQLHNLPLLVNINAKACILRTICEARHYLLPPGISLFQDIVRTLFTLPEDSDDIHDEYTQAMRTTEDKCRQNYAQECPYSALGYLLSNERPII